MADPRFELHIRPMFRAIDREHMLSRFDLWSYGHVVANIDVLLSRLSTDMPTVSSGGPWPPEWVDLFRRWKDSGCKQLELGAATYTRSQVGNKFVIVAEGTFPAGDYRGWLQMAEEAGQERTYFLYFDRPDVPGSGAPQRFSFRERYPVTDTRSVVVRDAGGDHVLAATSAPAHLKSLESMSDLQFFSPAR